MRAGVDVAIVGCGAVVRRNYARVMVGRPEYRVRYVYDADPQRAAETAALFSAEVRPPDAFGDIEAVVITTPPSTHAGLIREVVAPGRTILCEKPFVTSHREAREALDGARAGGATLAIGQFRRTFPQLELAHELIRLGAIGTPERFVASEGGRFSWPVVSSYPTSDPAGGVLWDTGSHTLDMALFAAGVDEWPDVDVRISGVQRDKPEPSHDFEASFELAAAGRMLHARLHVSRREALPNVIRIGGSRGDICLAVGMDDRVRLTTESGTTILRAEAAYGEILECFDLEVRRVLLGDPRGAVFAAERFVNQVGILEALAHA